MSAHWQPGLISSALRAYDLAPEESLIACQFQFNIYISIEAFTVLRDLSADENLELRSLSAIPSTFRGSILVLAKLGKVRTQRAVS